ncbi:MFS transporter [Colwellia ponticola]|uniref:MFS transporter n=1 Tax=Colwellia ponticola TaxID=2304625 RepID=A0A8H2PLH6_9GAMM|nr:MFS transporter [Colwellia ponticola]TMM46981.1 MFS transporter [Colwellia ponticola]
MNITPSYWRQHALLLVLTLLYIESFIGRQIMAVMIEPIKAEFGASDTQMGLLTGLGFAIVFIFTGLLAGRLADKVNRTRLLAASALVWCVITALSGLATGFFTLLLMRMMIAVAEAPVTSASLSLLSDSYPIERRSFAISCFTSGATFAAIIALTVGAYWVEQYGWRQTFFIISTPALFISFVLFFIMPEPSRGQYDEANTSATENIPTVLATGFRASIKTLLKRKDYCLLVSSSAIATLGANAFGMWNATFLVRSHELTISQAGMMAGFFGGGAAAIGILLSGYLADRIAKRKGVLWLPILGHILGWISIVIYFLWPKGLGDELSFSGIPFAMLFCTLASFFSVWWVSPCLTLLTGIVPSSQRALAISIQTVIITFVGVGVGPMLVGVISELLSDQMGTESLRYALLISSGTTLMSVFLLCKLKAHQALAKANIV